jgi:D-alanyl-D-alanine carboxypeptidase
MLIPTTPSAAQRGTPSVQLDGQGIDDMIASFMTERGIPGVTLAIVQAPYISRVVGYGVSDLETRRLASPKTLWNVGQMARAYTGVAIMQLVEAGKLRLDDSVGARLAGLPQTWQAVTVRQLLGHASGLPDYTTQPRFDPARNYTTDEILSLVRDVPPAFAPGARAAASATDFFLLARLVERASGISYEAFVTKNQIERLSLKNTVFASSVDTVKQETLDGAGAKHKRFLEDRPFIDPSEIATGYSAKTGSLTPSTGGSTWFGQPAIFASAEDISLWDIGLAGGLLVSSKDNRALLYAPATIGGGASVPANAGWRFPKHKGLMDIEGNVPGFSCYLARFTDLGRRIAGAFDRKLGPPVSAAKGLTSRESTYSVDETVGRLTSFLESKGVQVAARIDHAAAAAKAGLQLPPTQVVVFGNPAVGTHLMMAHPGVALDLPLRVLVWQEADGTVWAGYNDVGDLAARYGITDRADVIVSMRTALELAVKYATAPY